MSARHHGAPGVVGKYAALPSLLEDMESPMLAGAESYEWAAVANLDLFFARIYKYWAGRGLRTQVLSGALNLAALAFTVGFSGFLLLGVNWHQLLTAPCVIQDTCDMASVALANHPLASRGLLADVVILTYLAIFGVYWLWSAMHFLGDVRDMLEARHWVSNRLGVSDRGVGLMTWAELLHKLVVLQRTTRLCTARDLDEHDIVSRIMRKDNYMVALINKGVLRLTPPPVAPLVAGMAASAARGGAHMLGRVLAAAADACGTGVGATAPVLGDALRAAAAPLLAAGLPRPGPGWGRACAVAGTAGRRRVGASGLLAGRKPMLTKTLEWNLRWCVLDCMFDDKFCVRQDFLEQPEKLKQRLRRAAILNAALSPFLLLFLLVYFFMRNAERFYHHPGSAGSRRWTALARWKLREFNELPHYISHRLDAAHAPACHYVAQFPSHTVASVARFVSFVAGSFTAILLLLTMLDERLLERPLLGRHLVWWLASLGVLLTACRSFLNEEPVAYDPERAMQEVVLHTHYLPRHWRGRAHTAEVQAAFNHLFQFKVLLFLEELASVILTPFMLYFTLPHCADDIVRFVADFTVHVEGVGDVCSLSCFDLQAHGNPKYGAPLLPGGAVRKEVRTRQGKLEKSLLTFMATYPTWEPGPSGKAMLLSLSQHQPGMAMPGMGRLEGSLPFSGTPGAQPPSARAMPFHSTLTVGHAAFCGGAGLAAAVTTPASPPRAGGGGWGGWGAATADAAAAGAAWQACPAHENGSPRNRKLEPDHERPLGGAAGPLVVELARGEPVGDSTVPANGWPGPLLSAAAGQGDDQDRPQERQGEEEGCQHNAAPSEQPVGIGAKRAGEEAPGGEAAWGELAAPLHHSVFGVAPMHPSELLPPNHHHHPAPPQLGEAPSGLGRDGLGTGSPAASAAAFSTSGEAAPPGPGPGGAWNGTETDVWSLVSTPALLLPRNETDELSRRLAQGHAALQSLYELSDVSVQHRRLACVASAAGGGGGGAAGGSSNLWASSAASGGGSGRSSQAHFGPAAMLYHGTAWGYGGGGHRPFLHPLPAASLAHPYAPIPRGGWTHGGGGRGGPGTDLDVRGFGGHAAPTGHSPPGARAMQQRPDTMYSSLGAGGLI